MEPISIDRGNREWASAARANLGTPTSAASPSGDSRFSGDSSLIFTAMLPQVPLWQPVDSGYRCFREGLSELLGIKPLAGPSGPDFLRPLQEKSHPYTGRDQRGVLDLPLEYRVSLRKICDGMSPLANRRRFARLFGVLTFWGFPEFSPIYLRNRRLYVRILSDVFFRWTDR